MKCLAASLRHGATPAPAFLERAAFGAALHRGCAAPRRLLHPTFRSLPFSPNEIFQQVPVMPLTMTPVLTIPVSIPGASLRDRATLPSPLRGLGPSGGYPSRLRSLRSLRAPLGTAVRCAHRRLPSRRRRCPAPLQW